MIADGFSFEVLRQALETLAEYPLADGEILDRLKSLSNRLSHSGDSSSEPRRMLAKAIEAVEKAVAESESRPADER